MPRVAETGGESNFSPSVQVFGEERTIAPVGATFKDDFGPYEAHVYIVR